MDDTQLDQIIIKTFLEPLRQNLLRDLQTKMKSGRKENWFEIFLAVFILETNVQWLLRSSRENAKRCGAQQRYNSIKLAQEYFDASNILLAHFHHMGYGTSPLQLNFKCDKKQTQNELADHQIDFLRQVRGLVGNHKRQIEERRKAHQYEEALFWSGQMFDEQWVPVDREVREEKSSSSGWKDISHLVHVS